MTAEEIQQEAEKLYPKPDRSDFHTDTEYEHALVTYDWKVQQNAWIAGYKKCQEEYQEDTEKWKQVVDIAGKIRRPLADAESYHLSVGEVVTKLLDDYWEKRERNNDLESRCTVGSWD